ncbi:MAG: hypothetical protein ACOYYJ_06230 [Chloroflexota bacterium]
MSAIEKLSKPIERLWKKTLKADLPKSLKGQLLIIFAAGILAEIFFISLIVGMSVLYLLFGA